jgi:MFS family permease
MYPVIVAHANDHAPDNYFLRTSGGLLLLFGVGSIGGPLLAGVIMSATGPSGLFMTTALAHLGLIGYRAVAHPPARRADAGRKDRLRPDDTGPHVDDRDRLARSARRGGGSRAEPRRLTDAARRSP